MIQSDERCDRINESFSKAKNLYSNTKLNIKDEIDCIKCIDSLKISKKGRMKKNDDTPNAPATTTTTPTTTPTTTTQNTEAPGSRKTKIFQFIAENPEYLNKKRKTRSGQKFFKESDEDDDFDEIYQE